MAFQPYLSISALDYKTYDLLVWELNQNNAWNQVAAAIGFSTISIRSFATNSSPAKELLGEISIRDCTIGGLCEILDECQLYEALSLLSDPEPVEILRQPGNGTEDSVFVVSGEQLRLEVEARGLPPPSYIWLHGNEELPDQTTSVLCIDNFGEQHEGDYCCCMSQEGFNEVYSDTVRVEMFPEVPYILKQPCNITCCRGEEIILRCEFGGYPLPSIEWIFENTVLPEETSSTLIIPSVDISDCGTYYCRIKNNYGEVVSDRVDVFVLEGDECEHQELERLTASEKIALLIANDDYGENLSCLRTPSSDVATLSFILRHLGFKVLALKNLTLVEMRNVVHKFCEMLPEGAYAIFYFAGHGFNLQGKYMLPVDAPDAESYLRSDCLAEMEVIKEVLQTRPQLFVILLDMCLKTPDQMLNPGIYGEKAEVFDFIPRRNLIQGYATTVSLGAYERNGEENGIYMKHLKKFLAEDCTIMKILEKVNDSIASEPKDAAELMMPSYTNNVISNLHYLTNPAEENETATDLYMRYTSLPPTASLTFKRINTFATLKFHLHRGCFQNVMEIQIMNLERWTVGCGTQCMGLHMALQRVEKNLILIVSNLQKVKIPNISINIILRDRETEKLVDNALLELERDTLITSAQLWFSPPDSSD